MKYLIDTHIFIWTLLEPEKLSSNTVNAMNLSEQVFVSSITFWEIALKFSIGKLDLNNIAPDQLPDIALKCGLNILEIDSGLMSTFYNLPKLPHKDPFDRMIIWSAISKNLTLISNDNSFIEYKKFGLKLLT